MPTETRPVEPTMSCRLNVSVDSAERRALKAPNTTPEPRRPATTPVSVATPGPAFKPWSPNRPPTPNMSMKPSRSAGESPTTLLLGLIALFGVGGLFGLHGLNAGPGVATLTGVVAGLLGSGVVFGAFKALRSAESTETFSLQDMVGSTGRVSVGIPANHFGSVLISFAGSTHNMTATADAEIPAGREVKVVSVAGTNLVVAATTATKEGARSDA